MKKYEGSEFTYYNGVVLYPFLMVLLIWVVFFLDVTYHWHAYEWGVFPGTLKGLRGILFAPLLHGSLAHLYSNTLPVFFLGASLFYFYPRASWKVLITGYIATGAITWVIGRPSYHIGISGMIYLLSSFIFFKGIFSKYYRLIALSLAVVLFYGGTVWYVFPIKEEISWESHLGGFVIGLLLAVFIKTPVFKRERYHGDKLEYRWRDDTFMEHFDEHGNFIPESERLKEMQDDIVPEQEEIKFVYIYKKKDEDNSESQSN